jgi:hypothetical protein
LLQDELVVATGAKVLHVDTNTGKVWHTASRFEDRQQLTIAVDHDMKLMATSGETAGKENAASNGYSASARSFIELWRL